MPGRSINLALSHRGRKALRGIGLEDKILESGVPMYGRLLHSNDGNQTSVPYDPERKNVSITCIAFCVTKIRTVTQLIITFIHA